MTDQGWVSEAWDRNELARTRLPRIEELPVAADGYDRDAVREAFDAFYRHAAQLDATLQVLESVEVFGRQASELRADLRTLRAASWAPLAHRPTWTPAHRTPVAARAGSGVPEALPRLAVEVAFIILVAVGAALAELNTVLIVLLVLASWLLVGIAEFVASSRRATMRPGLLPPPRRSTDVASAGEAAEADQAQEELVPARVEETMIETFAEAEEAAAPVAETDDVPETDAVGEEISDAEPEPAPATEPEAEIGVVATPVEAAAPSRRRRFWRRRASRAEAEPVAQAKHVRVLLPEEVDGQADAAELRGSEPPRPVDPWEHEPELPVAEDLPGEAAPADEPERMADPAVDARAVRADNEDDLALGADDGLQPVAEESPEQQGEQESEPTARAAPEPDHEAEASSDADRAEWEAPVPEAAAEPEADPIVEAVLEPEAERESESVLEVEQEPEPAPLAEIESEPEAVADVAPEPVWTGERDELNAGTALEAPSGSSELEAEPALSSSRHDGLADDPWTNLEQVVEPEPVRVGAAEEDVPGPQHPGEAAPFEAEPEAEGSEIEPPPVEPIPEAAPFESEPEEEAIAPASARRWPWRRGRRDQAGAAAEVQPVPEPQSLPEPERSHVELIEIDQPIDPSRVDVPWEADSPFGADPKPADTWSQPAQFAGEPDEFQALGRDTSESAGEAHGGEPDLKPPGRVPLVELGNARDRSQIRSRRGRR